MSRRSPLRAIMFVFALISAFAMTSTLALVSNTKNSLLIDAFSNQTKRKTSNTAHYFKAASLGGKENESAPSKVKVEKPRDKPQTASNVRYHVRLKAVDEIDRRHVATRLVRFFPDFSLKAADEIANMAVQEGTALVKIMHSLADAEEVVLHLRTANPSIAAEIYDAKEKKVVTF